MNKKLSFTILLCFFICGVLHAQRFSAIDISDEKVLEEVNSITNNFDDKISKKKKISLLEEIAEILLNAGQYEAAEKACKYLLDEDIPKKKKFYYLMKTGDLYAWRENYSLSLDYYKKAQSLYKKNVEVKLKIGDILIQSNLYNLAEQNFLEALKLDKNSDYARKRLGDIWYYQGLYVKAWGFYSQIAPKNYTKDAIINMAVCCRNLNKREEGMRLVNNFLKTHESPELFFISGMLYADKKNYKMAQEQFMNSLSLDENNFTVYVYLANIYLNNGELDKAKEFLDEAYKIDSSYAAIDFMYAETAFKGGKIYEARMYAHNALLKAKTPFMKDQAQKMIDFLKSKDNRF